MGTWLRLLMVMGVVLMMILCASFACFSRIVFTVSVMILTVRVCPHTVRANRIPC